MRKTAISVLMMGMFVGVCVCYANPEKVTFRSPLVWRGEANEAFEMGTPLATDAEIKSITANWKSVGDVTLEASADSGLHYTPVVNGLALTSGFIAGDRLKWRAKPGPDSKLTEVKISYTDASGVTGTFGSPQLSGFKFRKPIYINGPTSGDLFNYQIKIKVGQSENVQTDSNSYDVHCSGNVQTDFRDIRFTAADGQTTLPYYLETITGTSPNQIAYFWVKVPQIPTQGITIYLYYYGNSGAASLSNPQDTFDLFDDFNQQTLDTNTWTVNLKQNGSYSVSDSKLQLDAAEILSKEFKFKDGIIEYAATLKTSNETGLIIRSKGVSPDDGQLDDKSEVAYSSTYNGAEHCITVNDIVKANDAKPITTGTKYNYRVSVKAGQITFERYDQYFKELQAQASFNDTAWPTKGYIGLKSLGQGNGKSVTEYEWLRVRRYSATAIEVDTAKTKAAKEEEVNLPVFNGLTLSGDGNLTLQDTYKEGAYISKQISSTFPIRIIIPTLTKSKNSTTDNSGISLDVSADKGKNYKAGCQNNAYYYASKKDFTADSNLVYRLKLSRKDSGSLSPEVEKVSLDYRPGKVNIISPNGGEVWGIGTQKEISWIALDYELAYPFDIAYSIDNGKTYTDIVTKKENDGVYLWTIPDKVSSTVTVKISDSFDKEVYDTSDKPFGISKVGEKLNLEKEGVANWQDSSNWAGNKIPNLNTEVVIDKDVTVHTGADIKFKTLIIGDGIGAHTSRLILTHNLDPQCTQIIIRRGGELIQDNANTQFLTGDLTIESGGVLTHSQNIDTVKYKIDFSAQNITLGPQAKVLADKKGYAGGAPGKAGFGEAMEISGLERQPAQLGNGGAGGRATKGGAGGGVIRLDARGTFLIYGSITALGEYGERDAEDKDVASGGGGGSIYLSANLFGGDGAEIFALGGSGHNTGAAGSGGRIYVKGHGEIKGTVNVNGGEGITKGNAGSIVFE